MDTSRTNDRAAFGEAHLEGDRTRSQHQPQANDLDYRNRRLRRAICPRSRIVREILSGIPTSTGEQAASVAEREMRLFQWIYRTISDKREITRVSRSEWDRAFETVLRPEEVFCCGTGSGRATNLDLALLFAACLEGAGLRPVVILRETPHAIEHALIGCWKSSEPSLGAEISGERLRREHDAGRLLAVDCDGAMWRGEIMIPARKLTFEDAEQKATDGEMNWTLGLDISAMGSPQDGSHSQDPHGAPPTSMDPTDASDPIVGLTLKMSLQVLNDVHGCQAEKRLRELAIFPDNEPVHRDVIARLWNATGRMDPSASNRLCDLLGNMSLVQASSDGILLHDVIREYLMHDLGPEVRHLHGALLEETWRHHGLTSWADLPKSETFMWRHLAFHMMGAGLTAELDGVLFDIEWMSAKLSTQGLSRLIFDYDYLTDHRDAFALQVVLRQAAPVLSRDPDELASELKIRLSGSASPRLRHLALKCSVLQCVACP